MRQGGCPALLKRASHATPLSKRPDRDSGQPAASFSQTAGWQFESAGRVRKLRHLQGAHFQGYDRSRGSRMEPHVFYARTTDDVTIAYAVVGAGPTLVLLPGVPFSNFLEEWRIPVPPCLCVRLPLRLQVVPYEGPGDRHSPR